jgi:TPR repeat protein
MILPMGVVRADAAQTQDQLVQRGIALYEDGAYAEAKAILLPLAEAGHPQAMNYIGLMHDDGFVFPKDPKVECDWYERAANVGYANAMYNMSICYDGFGRPDDPEQDKQWLLKAAEHGVSAAMINLAALDLAEGEHYRYWMNRAVQHGSVYAQVSLWLQGYKHDVPNIKVQDIVCVSVLILILDKPFEACD